jgi:hypothetical protein
MGGTGGEGGEGGGMEQSTPDQPLVQEQEYAR